MNSIGLQYGTKGSLYMSVCEGNGEGSGHHLLANLQGAVERAARVNDYLVSSRVRKPKDLFLRYAHLNRPLSPHASISRSLLTLAHTAGMPVSVGLFS